MKRLIPRFRRRVQRRGTNEPCQDTTLRLMRATAPDTYNPHPYSQPTRSVFTFPTAHTPCARKGRGRSGHVPPRTTREGGGAAVAVTEGVTRDVARGGVEEDAAREGRRATSVGHVGRDNRHRARCGDVCVCRSVSVLKRMIWPLWTSLA